jgi:AcrR family transcriptional regulator
MVQTAKATQRERLLAGMVTVANRGGYAAANVSAVIAEAAVSRPTFYESFSDRDACFIAAIAQAHEVLLEHVEPAVAQAPGGQETAALVEAIIAFAAATPPLARFLMSEAMGGGPAALDARDEGVTRVAQVADSARDPEIEAPDLDHEILIGGLYRLLSRRLRRGEPALSRLTEELQAWVAAYEKPGGQHRWRSLSPGTAAPRSPYVPDVPIQETIEMQKLPQGRQRLSEEQVAENHRLRILYAAARMAERKGYTATTVGDIAELAKLDKHVFYRYFSDKQSAFMSVHELGFQQVMDVTSSAFFAGKDWPERSWEAGRALTQLLEDNPLVAHVGFVEAHAVGPGAVQRIEDSHIAFMFFLQEGLVYRKQAVTPTRLAMEAIIASIFEIIYRQARAEGTPQVAAMLPHIAHLWLTPFLGSRQAEKFIAARQRDGQSSPGTGARTVG